MIPLALLPSVFALAAVAPSPPPARLSAHLRSARTVLPNDGGGLLLNAAVLQTDPVVLTVGQEQRFLVGYWREPFCDDYHLIDVGIRTVSKDDNELRFRGLKPGTTLCRVSMSLAFESQFIFIPIVVR